MIKKNLGFNDLSSKTIYSLPKTKVLIPIGVAFIIVTTLDVISLMGTNINANPCSDITSTGGNGGSGGPGGLGIGIGIGGPGIGIGGNGGSGGPGGNGQTSVECTFEDVLIVE